MKTNTRGHLSICLNQTWKLYRGRRDGSQVIVTVNDILLNPRLDLCDHSPTGFEWGYVGSGPAQLALALLAEHLNDDKEALLLYQGFKRMLVLRLSKVRWTLTTQQIQKALKSIHGTGTFVK